MKVGHWAFKRDLKKNQRFKSVCNLENARSIGILYDATSEQNIQNIQPFVSYFFELKKDVKALGFVNSKELSYCHTPKLQYDFFYQKDLNWYYKPQNYIIKNFVEKDYDILINLCDSNCIPVKYLAGISQAKFKVGKYEEDIDLYDMMIDVKENTLSALIKEIHHYLTVINQKDAS